MTGGDLTDIRDALRRRGMSVREAARRTQYDPAYLSRALNGRQPASPALLASLRSVLGFDEPAYDGPATPSGSTEYVRSAVAHFLEHDRRHGGDHVVDAALQVWRSEQRKLDRVVAPTRDRISAVAEIAEVAGWVAFDADRRADARQALMESAALARSAGDRPLQWFATDLRAMAAIQYGAPGEAIRLVDEITDHPSLPPRVALLSRIRRARALAMAGDRARSLDLIERATGGLQDSLTPRDPGWAWWVDSVEITGHRGEVLLSLGEADKALPHLRHARFASAESGRGHLYYSVAELTALVDARAWPECAEVLEVIHEELHHVSSARSRGRLAGTLRRLTDAAPAPVVRAGRDVEELLRAA
ncbi:helix-turn-helix domain-containing protein [Streptomyces albidoflavus]|uniref:helix-turn-helix domain-containing protein n=1 Tax=Streptomyces albidoflavus TaxID=1886 RepID=UPI001021FF1A|nr:helix-turn-helix transcriptional regulator [Streptomyces albidoflavus]